MGQPGQMPPSLTFAGFELGRFTPGAQEALTRAAPSEPHDSGGRHAGAAPCHVGAWFLHKGRQGLREIHGDRRVRDHPIERRIHRFQVVAQPVGSVVRRPL